MNYLVRMSALVLIVMLVTACTDDSIPTATVDEPNVEAVTGPLDMNRVVHHASVGGNDICEAFGLEPGCDANFSLTANMKEDGTISGIWHDQFAGGTGVHATLDCLEVDGNVAWVSGMGTKGVYEGVPVITMMVDNGTSNNDPPDLVSFSQEDVYGGCTSRPDLPLFELYRGQVKVW